MSDNGSAVVLPVSLNAGRFASVVDVASSILCRLRDGELVKSSMWSWFGFDLTATLKVEVQVVLT